MIPGCLKLNEYQRKQVDRFVQTLEPVDIEETCTVDSPLVFTIRRTGIGDVVWVEAQGRKLYLDDGLDP